MTTSGNGDAQGDGVRKHSFYSLTIESVSDLYAQLAPRLCPDGLFIETNQPVEPESEVGFRVLLPDGVVVIRGRGHVIWVRPSDGIEGRGGMAVRFADIDPDTRETIDALIDAHLASGGELFDLDEDSPFEDTFPTDALHPSPAAAADTLWKRDLEPEETQAAAAVGSGDGLSAANDSGDVDLEQVIASFTLETAEGRSIGDRSLDDAIAEAVGVNSGPHTNLNQAGFGESTPGQDPPREAIPDVLDQWKKELEIAGQGPLPPDTEADGSVETRPWESLLPFDGDEHSEQVAPTPWTPPDDTSTSARRAPRRNRSSKRWWVVILIAGAVAVLGFAVLTWIGASDHDQPVATTIGDVESAARKPSTATPIIDDRAVAAEPEIAPTAVPPTPSPVARKAVFVVDDISWQSAVGRTEVIILASRPIGASSADAIRLDDPPRVLVRLRGVERPFTPYRIEVGTPEVKAIRIGYHPEREPDELYVVLDLASESVSTGRALVVDGSRAVVTVRSGT